MKGITGIEVLIGIVVISALAVVAVPGLGNSVASIVQNQVKYCTDTPYDFKCICTSGYDKSFATTGLIPGIITYACIPSVQPTSYTFPIASNDKSAQLAYVRDYLIENYPSCNTINCEAPMFKSYSYPSGGYVWIECLEQTFTIVGGGTSYWRVVFSLTDGSIFAPTASYSPFCASK